jgi:hypothetical protein
VEAMVTDVDAEFVFGGKGHPFETEVALDLESFEMARQHFF